MPTNKETSECRGELVDVRPEPDLAGTGAVVLDTSAGLHLASSRCPECSSSAFPPLKFCLECGTATKIVALANRGRLYAFTTVRVSATRPTPYTIGYVDLEDGVRLLSPVSDPDNVVVDELVRLDVTEDGAYVVHPIQQEVEQPR